jgi:hypothetical protein
MSGPLFDRLLAIGRGEKILGFESLPLFAAAFRERGHVILDEVKRPLLERLAALEKETAWQQETIGNLRGEIEGLRREWQAASAAHDRLLEHHRQLLRTLVTALEPLETAPRWRYRNLVLARLADVLAILRKERT